MQLSKAAIKTLIGCFIAVVLLGWLVGNYNSLVGARNATDKSRAKVQTQEQKRYDTIGNLVETVKGSQAQESKVFGQIADARKQTAPASGTSGAKQADAAAATVVTNLQRLQEAYPELKSNDNVKQLMTDLKTIETDIAKARDNYNDTATNYNTNVASFPKNIFASIFGFQKRDLFEAESGAEKGVKVKF